LLPDVFVLLLITSFADYKIFRVYNVSLWLAHIVDYAVYDFGDVELDTLRRVILVS